MRLLLFAIALAAAAVGCSSTTGSGGAHDSKFAKVDMLPDAKRWLGKDTARASEAGAEEPIVVSVGAGAPGDRLTGMITVPVESCALLLARGADSVDDVDLFAYSDDGAVLGADEDSNKNAGVIVCPPHPRHVYVVARIAAGHGIVAVSAQRVPEKSAENVGAAVNARGRPGEAAASTDSWPGLDEKLAEHLRQVGGRWQSLRRAALPLDPRVPTNISARIEPQSCLDALVIPSDEVSHLDLTALDTAGRVIGRAATLGRDRGLVICSPIQAVVTLELRPHAGRGLAAVLLSRSIGEITPDVATDVVTVQVAPGRPLDVERAALESALGDNYAAPVLVANSQIKVGNQSSHDVDLPVGCARIDVVGGSPTRGIEAWLWTDSDELIAHESGGSTAVLFACALGGRARLDVEAVAHAGPIAIELRPAPQANSVLMQEPLAASRLLTRLLALGFIPAPREAGSPRRLDLAPDHTKHEQATVPIGRCMTFVAALGPGSTGVELRLTDAATDEEIALSRGTVSTWARACSLDRPGTLEVDVRVRVLAGRGHGLLGSRMTSPER